MDKIFFVVAFVAVLLQFAYSQKCCFPNKWEGIEGVSIGIDNQGAGSAVEGAFKVSYLNDGKDQKVAAKGKLTINGKQQIIEKILYDYTNKRLYTVVDGKCTKSPLNETLMGCIPDNAKLILDTYYGIGDKKLDVEMYSFTYKYMQQMMRTTISVTKEGCVPVSEHFLGLNMLIDAGFMGLTSGIKNMTVFNVPTECNHDMTVPQVPPELHYLKQPRGSIFGRFH